MSDLDVTGLLARVLPQGPGPAADTSLTTIGTVTAVDPAAGMVEITVRGARLLLAAQPGRYSEGGAARVLLDPTAGRPVMVWGPINPAPQVALARVVSVSGDTVTVAWGESTKALPAIPSTYTPNLSAYVHRDDWGTPTLVLGPSDIPDTLPPPSPSTPGGGPAPSTQTVEVVIGPQWSGTFRHIRGAWDRWNTNRYGGRSTLYQGDAYGSGPLTGLAVYGDQVANLGAVSILSMGVKLNGVGLAASSGTPTVIGAANGTPPGGAPTTGGPTASGWGWVTLPPEMNEAFRTGGIKGLALVGSGYQAVAGAGNGDGMSLAVRYTRRV